ncbi:MAG TPA: glycoside hydrolase family 9 protein [Fibrobacteria bacterium]|nr:glycoside hydrolase family 9 protein [Fibrobacteria bacterium]
MRTFVRLVAILFAAASFAGAADIDNTCATCGRTSLDSANLHVGAVRVNQVGYRTGDVQKNAFVGSPSATTFQVLRANRTVAYSGTLKDLGSYPFKGRILIRGYFNSITPLYQMANTANLDSADASSVERLWVAEFGTLSEEGTFRVAVGSDTSLPFEIRKTIYNDVFETSLKFFGWQRSGDNDSWAHGPSHMMDGSGRPGGAAKAGSLQGGWYDCGDYFKVGQTIAYAFTNLVLTYSLWPQKAEDRYGASYNDTIPFGNDGYPDLLMEAKIGADYVMRLYRASREDGLLADNRMYQDVGVWMNDHMYWDRPENADAAPVAKGGPDRPVVGAKGSAVPAQFAGSLALFAMAWEPFDPDFADSCLAAAKDIYAKVVLPNWRTPGPGTVDGFYIQQTRWDDDLAWAAANLYHATRDTMYRHQLMEDRTYGTNANYVFNFETFRGGFMAMHASKLFSPGGWVMDYQNTHIHTVWLLFQKIYRTDSLAATWGIPAADAQNVRTRLRTLVGKRHVRESTNGNGVYPGTLAHILKPYNLVWSSITWGMNRYNMGGLLPIVAYHEMIRDDSAASAVPYLNLVLDNMDYNLGRNPWDISFLMGAGSKNLQHPHNRIANPEGYNAGGIPYPYRSPKGALMGGAIPGQLLRDEWEKYDVTETCIDFSAQMVLPSQYLAEDLPPDHEGPKFSNVVVVQVTNTTALVSWETDELSRDTLFYSLTPGGPVVGKVAVNLAKKKSAEITGLTPDTRYHFFFTGMDIYRNVSRDDNRGRYYEFTTTTTAAPPVNIFDVKVCNIRHDRATVFWWTDVVSTSAVEYAVEGADFASTKVRVEGDDEGVPGRFHKVTLKGLKPGTSYRFDAISGTARGDSGGLHHRFTTIKDFANYTIQIKPTTKNGATNGHFYLEVANNDPKPYVGLELRFYFQADAATAASLVVNTSDDAIFDVTGTMRKSGPSIVSFGAAVAVPGIADQWYIPIVIKDTLPVAGRARLEMKMDNGNWNPQPMSIFRDAWSLRPQASPVAFAGVDLSRPWVGPDHVEVRDGAPVVTYTQTPYIAAFFEGVHIYGYPPDGTKPRVHRTTLFDFASPLPSPATSVKQDSFPVRFGGRTWSFPDVVAAQWQVDGPSLRPVAPLAGQTDSVAFAHDTLDSQGANVHEFAFWGDRDSSYCSCSWQRYLVAVDTMKIPPPRYRLVWTPAAGPLREYVGKPIRVSLRLNSDSLDTVKLDAPVSLALPAGIRAGVSAADSLGAGSIRLVGGVADVWLFASLPESAFSIVASAAIAGAVVDPATLAPVAFVALPPWPIVDSAWTRDVDCDGMPDSVLVALSQEPGAEVALVSLALSLDGAASTTSSAAISRNGRILSIAAPAGLAGSGSGAGSLAIHVTSGGRDLDTVLAFAVADRTGPVALAVSALERFAPGMDTVRVSFSEPVLSGGAWPFAQSRSGTALPGPTGATVGDPLPTLLEWSLSGTSFLAGDLLAWAVPSAVVDAAGNPAQDCRAPGAVSLRRGNVPLDGASLLDADGDGRVDSLRLRFRRGLGLGEMPDSVRVSWGAPSVSWTVPGSAVSRSADSSTLSAPVAFAWGATSWAGTGNNVLVVQGDAVSGRRDLALAADQVGPVLLAAVLRRGPTADTLRIRVSESVIAAAGADLQRRIGGVWTSLLRLPVSDSVTWRLVASQGAFQDGDSVRLAGAGLGGGWFDASGNAAAPNAPWIRVQAGDPAPVSAVVLDQDGDGRAESVRLTWDRVPRRGHGFLFAASDTTGRIVLRAVDSGSVAMDASGTGATVALPDPFPFGATSGFGTGIQIEIFADGSVDSLPFALSDGAGPVATSAHLRYASQGQSLDTLVVRTSEAVVFGGAAFFQLQSADGTVAAVAGTGLWQSTDGRTAWILLDPTSPASTTFRKGDKIRIQPASLAGGTDAAGNPALDLGHLETVVFGTRPPRFSLDFLPSTLLKSTGLQAPGAAVEILVRPSGNDAWTTLSGDPAPARGERIGPRIKTNSVFGGSLAIFDNLGVFVAGVDLSGLRAAGRLESLSTDPAGQYEVWVAWNGTDTRGKPAASGVYVVRLILRRDGDTGKALDESWLNRVYRIGWMVK